MPLGLNQLAQWDLERQRAVHEVTQTQARVLDPPALEPPVGRERNPSRPGELSLSQAPADAPSSEDSVVAAVLFERGQELLAALELLHAA